MSMLSKLKSIESSDVLKPIQISGTKPKKNILNLVYVRLNKGSALIEISDISLLYLGIYAML